MAGIEDYLHPLKTAYRLSPASFKHTAGRVYAALPDRVKYGKIYTDAVAELNQSQHFSRTEHESLQLKKLQNLLAHCWKNVPFYQKYWSDHGLQDEAITELSDIRRYPMIDKALVRENLESLVAEGYRSQLLPFNTGGSTGIPLKFYWERGRTRSLERAFIHRQWQWGEFTMGQRAAVLRGQTIKYGKHFDPIDLSLIHI